MAKKYLDDSGLSYLWGKLKDYFQVKLVSGTNIKTINNNSLLGNGNITISGGGGVTPDDYVVEQGTSGIWTYRKWDSGIAECWTKQSYTTLKASTAWGNLYYGTVASTLTFPSGLFTAAPEIQLNLTSASGRFWASHANDMTASKVGTIYNLAPQQYTGNNAGTLSIYAIGAWE